MHFLDEHPFDIGNPLSRELRDLLARHIRSPRDVEELMERARVPIEDVHFGQPPRHLWTDVLREARAQSTRSDDRLRALLHAAVERYPAISERLDDLLGASPIMAPESPKPATLANLPGAPELERILGARSSLVDIGWLARGAEVATAVGRLTVSSPSNRSYGTGFLVGPRRVLTNAHVLPGATTAVELWLGYELDARGRASEVEVHPGAVASIRRTDDAALDWATIELESAPSDRFARLPLSPSAPLEVGDHVAVVQHPGAERKKLGVLTNTVVALVDAPMGGSRRRAYVQYLTDTEPGSSGSPVFNDRWEVVALHYGSVERSPASPATSSFANAGVLIEHVRDAIARLG
jgi:V8-like Glu-specific endopeptidase